MKRKDKVNTMLGAPGIESLRPHRPIGRTRTLLAPTPRASRGGSSHSKKSASMNDSNVTDAPSSTQNPSAVAFGLTPAEQHVLALAAQGKTTDEIARARGCHSGTVRIQLSAVFRKLQVRNRGEAILVALRSGIVAERQMELTGVASMELRALMPHVVHRRYRAGSVLFRRGDNATELFLLQRGRVQLLEGGTELESGDHFGEVGLFSPSRTRISTAVCVTDASLFVLDDCKVKQLYVADAGFALTLLRSITRRLMEDTAYIA